MYHNSRSRARHKRHAGRFIRIELSVIERDVLRHMAKAVDIEPLFFDHRQGQPDPGDSIPVTRVLDKVGVAGNKKNKQEYRYLIRGSNCPSDLLIFNFYTALSPV